MKKVLAVIPARLNSTRLSEKMIQSINGRPLIWYPFSQCMKAELVDDIIVAVDDIRVEKICHQFDIPTIMTGSHHRSGTERLIEVSQHIEADIYINIQGDEPLIQPEMIDSIVNPFLYHDFNGITTLKKAITDLAEIKDPNVVKVVCDNRNQALYFSRAPIPYHHTNINRLFFKHIGIYGYPKKILQQLGHLSPDPIEMAENLEQIRFLSNQIPIMLIETTINTISVDTPQDLNRVRDYFLKKS